MRFEILILTGPYETYHQRIRTYKKKPAFSLNFIIKLNVSTIISCTISSPVYKISFIPTEVIYYNFYNTKKIDSTR